MYIVCNILVATIILLIMSGPWWWMEWLTDEQHEKYSTIALYTLIPLAFMLTFGGNPKFWDPKYTAFSNDGPMGVMKSEWLAEPMKEGPGSPLWNDTYWLGSNNGTTPLSLYYVILWAVCNPENIIIFTMFWMISIVILWCIWKLFTVKKSYGP